MPLVRRGERDVMGRIWGPCLIDTVVPRLIPRSLGWIFHAEPPPAVHCNSPASTRHAGTLAAHSCVSGRQRTLARPEASLGRHVYGSRALASARQVPAAA